MFYRIKEISKRSSHDVVYFVEQQKRFLFFTWWVEISRGFINIQSAYDFIKCDIPFADDIVVSYEYVDLRKLK